MNEYISIEGAKTNNLKNVSLKFPKYQISVVTGVSGSGKSSLVFDTLAAESQRLLNETYSSYIQQLLPHYTQPIVDKIENLPVSIVISQKKIGGNARSTVGTVTDIYSSLRLLFSRIATPFIGYSMTYSFNNTQGMCEMCKGLGETKQIDLSKLIDFDKSLNDGAIDFPTFQPGGWRLTRYTESGNFDNDKKIKEYNERELDLLLNDLGSSPIHPSAKWPKTANYVGIIPRITKNFIEKENDKYTERLNRILKVKECPSCRGTRVNKRVRSAKINDKSIADCVTMPISELVTFIKEIKSPTVQIILEDLIKKLKSLEDVGLDYLFLNRPTTTLSGGESQRIKMTKHLNSALSDVLYIFDEPSIGLHPEDIQGISKIIKGLKDKGNTVVLVDHDPDIIEIADHIIEIGPGAGEKGGHITFEGTYEELLRSNTVTEKVLSTNLTINPERKKFSSQYTLEKVSLHNVTRASIKIPKQSLTIVTGVAGSGKSTLIRYLFKSKYPEANILDQSQIIGSIRSNALTYLNVFDKIRSIFAHHSGKSASLFSYNGQGACPICKGKGYIKLDLAYMGNVEQVCEACHGKRYNAEALSVLWQSLNIYDLLQLPVNKAIDLFEDDALTRVMQALIDVNLGYIKLGQSLDTYSGGERQRLKIAKIIYQEASDLLILDEPSTGLHESDIDKLLLLFHKLLEKNKTLIVLEHNLKIISNAQWIIDMGPGGGNLGGKVLFEGYPVDLLKMKDSYTAKHLRKYINDKK
ncbi:MULTISPECIES: ATP-binding cassette domain-containing protein [Enterococcus]|uniref:UvrABC system protein A n=1 Tax=Enterococcus raffinosus TaxID=71452 RepID=A0AAP5NDT2_9ENTE|nr:MULTISPECIES: ATP-binding cassette domain-containing protein [Enterococcus]SAZ81339.1 excinuclease ABC subunit A [Enterococcus faecium]MDT2524464.1 ATP-binding cassette domain-containing protein [Enterococcus raffinosus]MDT2535132.1 ATP-binding cassette domain-containing protein [Enterococcus raffinosus]MDT2545656.1 ATP-binding cassette domain-containing protein [Enterococcus raffinosus]MDT2553931.1 ATP-binding cassette domain-containing protein [Enterococcus raffinosus]